MPCSSERFPWHRLSGALAEGLAPPRFPLSTPPRRKEGGVSSPSASQSGSSSEGPLRVLLTSVSQNGLSSEGSWRVSLMGVFQRGSSSEEPRRVSSTEELPGLAPRSHLWVFLHRAFSQKLVFEASPLWRFFGTSFLGIVSGEALVPSSEGTLAHHSRRSLLGVAPRSLP